MCLIRAGQYKYKLNAQYLRLFGVHDDVNDAHRAGANRLQNKAKTRQMIGTINFLHSFHEWLPPILSCGNAAQHCRLGLFQDSDFAGINIRRSFVHFWKSNICTDQLDVQEANVSVLQLHRVRDHIAGCLFACGRFACVRLLGLGHCGIPKPTQACTRETGVKTRITPKIEQVLDQNVDLSSIDQVPS